MVVVGVEEDQVAREVGVHQLQGEGSRQRSKEGPPHHLVREVVGDLHPPCTWGGVWVQQECLNAMKPWVHQYYVCNVRRYIHFIIQRHQNLLCDSQSK